MEQAHPDSFMSGRSLQQPHYLLQVKGLSTHKPISSDLQELPLAFPCYKAYRQRGYLTLSLFLMHGGTYDTAIMLSNFHDI